MKYLLNTWYAAAHGHEVTTAPLARTLLDQPVVMFRSANGRAVILQDRCPHRFAPLSRGTVMDDEIQCGYHGLRFDLNGACSHNPHGPVPPRAAVRAYPTFERYGLVWIWPGTPDLADPGMLPAFDFLEDPATYTVLPGLLHVKANYQLIVDNLLDLSHALFMHPHFAIPGQTVAEQLAAITTKTTVDGDRVTAWRARKAVPPNGPTRAIFGFGPELVDSRAHMHWHAPSVINFDVGTCLTGTPEENGMCIPQAHLITPETELTSHYFYAAARNLRREDPAAEKLLFDILDLAFRQQDEPMIEAVQERMGPTSDFDSLKPILLRIDGAPVEARRIMARLIRSEQECSSSFGA